MDAAAGSPQSAGDARPPEDRADATAALPAPPSASVPAPPGSPTPRPQSRFPPLTPRVGLLLLATLVMGIVLYMGREALSPFIVGLLLVYLLDPPIERLSRAGMPRWLAILVVYALVVFLVIEALTLTLRPLVDQLSTFLKDLPGLAASLDQQLQRLSEFYRGLELPPQLRQTLDEWLASLAEGGAGLSPGVLMPVVNVTAGLVSSIFGYLIIPVWAFYLLKDRRALTERFDQALPPGWRNDVWQVVRIVERVFGQWVRAQLFLGLTVGVATFVGLLVLSTWVDPIFGRFALLLAIIAGLLELLPIIGPIIAAVPAVLLAATAGVQAIVAALVLYTLVQQLENNLLVPKIQGDAVQLHPSAVMFALVVGGAIAGLLGAILALPITAAARDVYRYLFNRLSPAAEPSPASLQPSAALRPAAAAVPDGGEGAGSG